MLRITKLVGGREPPRRVRVRRNTTARPAHAADAPPPGISKPARYQFAEPLAFSNGNSDLALEVGGE
jgi:hypothetical protein